MRNLTLARAARTGVIATLALALGACTTLEDFLASVQREPVDEPQPLSLAELPVEDAIDANHFVIEGGRQSVVGTPQVVFTRSSDTLPDFALAYGIGYDEIVAANPDVDPWLPGDATPVLLPTQYVLPDVPREGIVLNIATKRLFYFPADAVERDAETGEVLRQSVITYPIGIGRVGWETPLGSTEVVSKAKDPTWWVPASVRKEHAEMGDPLPATVPPGPDNPLGHRVLKLDMPGYLIHGTNQPYGVGMRVSHGCVRLYPQNIEALYELVGVGEKVLIINEPYLLGELDGEWYFEGHEPLEDDTVDAAQRMADTLAAAGDLVDATTAGRLQAIAASATGVPVRIAAADQAEVFARVRRVHNIIEENPEAPSLDEVREMIDEAVADAEAEVAAN